ncbi:MAG: tetraacyldisaccharide 4'-kinase [Pseudobdellovibrio sp.]
MSLLNPYELIVHSKNFLYDKGMIDLVKADVPVISIGNLTTGGTGKTPMILFIIDLVLRKNPDLKILVISKSYKGTLRTPAPVNLEESHCFRKFGDEPVLIQRLRPDVQVWCGPIKSETLQRVLNYKKERRIDFDLILVDDGFSHRKIHRDLNIVLFDVSRDLNHYKILPFGHLRESLDEIKRGDLFILAKSNSAQNQTIQFITEKLNALGKWKIHAEFDSELVIDSPLNDIVLISGIGHPQQLETALRSKGFQILHHQQYVDHAEYSIQEQKNILQLVQKYPSAILCTTEKDFVKITNPDLLKVLKVIKLKIKIDKKEEDDMYEKIRTLF